MKSYSFDNDNELLSDQVIKPPSSLKTVISENIELNQIILNQTTLQYIRHPTPIEINHCIAKDDYYRFDLSTASKESFHIDGHSALIIQEPETETECDAHRIRIITVTFKQGTLLTSIKARYGIHFASIPWRTEIEEDSKHNTLLYALAIWIIQEQNKLHAPIDKHWLHVEKALLELFIDNLDRRDSVRPEEYEIKRTWFTELEQWIANNLTDPIALDDLALIAGVSVRAIQKAFREYRNCTPMDAVIQQRLLKAREMLMNPEKSMTVLDVAMNLGYLHPSRFASQYKKKFGENPSETIARSRAKKQRLA